ncbi:hypothetical protein [Asticcacaulis sp. AND118]|uniref:hypothetical protein n=1 Tax=Asticcacaulis sp. AND118 TaxID=2840468 RepID=UPI001CFFC171|nr:hypothetical protein [Asticcacaulis sp. AND118]UDF03286.1 hypothetical protein LH365_12715 [Asticcacaulis sp. AND118]
MTNIPGFTLPRMPEIPTIKSAPEYAFDALRLEMKGFQSRLTDEFELGAVANGAGLIIYVSGVRLSGHMIIFEGEDANGHKAILIQHFTQVNVQMIAVPKQKDEPRRIGF